MWFQQRKWLVVILACLTFSFSSIATAS